MSLKGYVILIYLAMVIVKLMLELVRYRSAGNPIPGNVSDVYDADTYLKWQHYHGEQGRLEMVSMLFSAAVMTALLLLDAHVVFAGLFGSSPIGAMFAVLVCQSLVDVVCSLPFAYISTMCIEEKYGFNRTTMKTFVKDQIISLIMDLVISSLIVLALYWSHQLLGDGMVVLLAPLLTRVQNKFTPLEDGSLRDKLTALLTRHGYTVKAIEVMDASRRTSKSNAFFSGFGKQKRIVLFDTLLETMDEDEICAVFAHELGHGLHKDIPKLLTMNCGNMVIIAVLAWLAVRYDALHQAFGFAQMNYGFAYLLLGTVALPVVMQLFGMVINAVSRRAEYAADAQAVQEGYGDALISGLKKLSKGNFAHLSPSKLLVVLEYSHPPLSERIAAIEQYKEK